MQNSLFNKTLVFGILVLFIGAGVFPVTGVIDKNEKIIENQNIIESQSTNDPILKDVDWWPMFHHDLNNSVYSSSKTAPQTNNIKWIYEIPDGAQVGSSPAVVDGRVYIGAETLNDKYFCLLIKNNLYEIIRFSPETGKILWEEQIIDTGKYKLYGIGFDNTEDEFPQYFPFKGQLTRFITVTINDYENDINMIFVIALQEEKIIKDYEALRKLHKEGIIAQVKSFPKKKKSMEHLAIGF